MDISGLKRNPAVIRKSLRKQKDLSVVTEQECKIYIPASWSGKGLVKIENEISITGVMATVIGQSYSVSRMLATFVITPTSINKVTIADGEYHEFTFEAGSTIFESTEAVVDDSLIFDLFDTIYQRGHTPWYMDELDCARLFEDVEHWCKVSLHVRHEVFEMITAARARDATDRTKYARHTKNKLPPVLIGLRNIQYGATNTTAKIIGSYSDIGVGSAIVNPSVSAEPIEQLLRR